jgi:hypothetical protein
MHLLLIRIHQAKTRLRYGYMPRGSLTESREGLYSAVCTVLLADLAPVARSPSPRAPAAPGALFRCLAL